MATSHQRILSTPLTNRLLQHLTSNDWLQLFINHCQLKTKSSIGPSSIYSANWFSQASDAELLFYKCHQFEWERGRIQKNMKETSVDFIGEVSVLCVHVSVTPQMAGGGWSWVCLLQQSDQLNPSNPTMPVSPCIDSSGLSQHMDIGTQAFICTQMTWWHK